MPHVKKRLIVACDGTWLNSDSGEAKDIQWPWSPKPPLKSDPSNVTRMCRAIATESKEGIPQICSYQPGVGSANDVSVHLLGGIVGRGVAENIRDAYLFIAHNWNPGDEIIVLGFSRGAFTARSVVSLIEDVGMLTNKGLVDFLLVFKDWENQLAPNYEYKWPEYFPQGEERPTFANGRYARELAQQDMTTLDVPVKAISVWDTVGALGIPNVGLVQLSKGWREFTFANTEVPKNIEYAFQALALDEHRAPFAPTLWEKPTGGTRCNLQLLKQCWFPGVHANVGGSYPDTGIADLALTWMISNLQTHGVLDVAPTYAAEQRRLNEAYYRALHPPQPPRPWGLGRLYDSYSALYRLAGRETRTPGRYARPDPATNEPTDVRLVHTEETIHASVRIRMELGGKGPEDVGGYRSEALKGWDCVPPDVEAPEATSPTAERNPTRKRHRWVSERGKDVVVLPEDELGEVELELLRMSEDVYQKFAQQLV